MQLVIKIYDKNEVEKVKGKSFFVDDPYIETLTIESGKQEYFISDDYDGPNIREEEISEIQTLIETLKRYAPSTCICYQSNQDEDTGEFIAYYSEEYKNDYEEADEDFYSDEPVGTDEWIEEFKQHI